jgi:rare lipoprotein A
MAPRNAMAAIGLALLCGLVGCAQTQTPASSTAQQVIPQPVPPATEQAVNQPAKPKVSQLDRSGRIQEGRASFISPRLADRTMADGNRLDPNANVIASKTLPLGTKAKVTNPATGKSTVVTVADRGPFVKGRVADVSPKVADELDMRDKGVGKVTVAPIAVPQANGSVKSGAGAAKADKKSDDNATGDTQAAER